MAQSNLHTDADGLASDSAPGDSLPVTAPNQDTDAERDDIERLTQPVDREDPPRLPFPVVGIGASAGGLEAVSEFLEAMRPDSGMAFVIVQHLPPDRISLMAEILGKKTAMPVAQVEDGLPVEPNHVYVIRPGHTLLIKDGTLHLGERLAKPGNNRPIDDFFKSLAVEQRERAIAIIMSGMGSNGAAGAQGVKAVGGLCIAQEPETAQFPSMPRHLIDAGYADYILRPSDMPDVLLAYAGHPYARGGREEQISLARRDQQHLREILAILRTRTRQDFNGYKKPTVFRRVQRRMGLNRITQIGSYAKFLRQTPSEVTALADDLLIHVTGFFRDPEAWETLRERVVVPLIAGREADSSVRAWVTACSSGEEAYTLAMLLVEEAERISKPLDIKVFATDMAERSLQNARHGIYPGGIESEIVPQRLERFFQREDAVYRVRQELRERVVFAPQNVLQDPPFSRLDIISCRNLLIYLEPEMQRRVLALLHFGLREGGTLFLGTSETAGPDELFEPVDKKARIFRRIGPTRHGSVDFPLPHAVVSDTRAERTSADMRNGARLSIAQLTTRALLESHTPAAITVDRDFRIIYYHGNTEPFLAAPRGEPTRDLMSLVRESIRGAVRAAIHSAVTHNAPVTVLDGWLETSPGQRNRIAVTASPLDPRNAGDYFVVSFQERGVQTGDGHPGATPEESERAPAELRRVRDELQSTIEELQTSNEELKASNEEVVSTNEELQSTNEELETSREEMQSLNEELSTVNSQLHAKIEEHQAASNDLSSLLTSTDIAVLFLDTRFRIRRYTPQVRDLVELIGTDIGRPLSDLAKKFTDPALLKDAETVLARLVPVEKEIAGEHDRWYLRRVTPYRTADNRIDGVVITFVEITARRQAEAGLRESEERFRMFVEGASDIGMIMLDLDGNITAWNASAQHLLAYDEEEAVGKNINIIYTAGDREAGIPQQDLAQAVATGLAADERWYVRKTAEQFWSSGTLTAARNEDGTLRGFVKIMRDETPRKRAEEALQISKENAEIANHVKDEFLAVLSHELRTPLSAILLWSKILLNNRELDREQMTEGLKSIHGSAEAQKELIEDLLDISRITSGKLRLQPRDMELAAVIHDAVEAISPTAEAKGVAMRLLLAENIGVIRADPDRIRQVMWNLLTNAVKFTPSGGSVEISAERHEDKIEIAVKDTGKGISKEFLPHIFERFRQADPSHTRAEGGVGLGLSIARQLIELHSGTISAFSEGPNRGATFRIDLPIAKGSAPLISPGADGDESGAPHSKTLQGLRVLLVEDDIPTRAGLRTMLQNAGLKVSEADTAQMAITSIESQKPDVIVSDIGLPAEDGYSLIRRIRQRELANKSRPIPAIALTAFARDTDKRVALESGFDRHIGKPVDAEDLLRNIRKAIAAKNGD